MLRYKALSVTNFNDNISQRIRVAYCSRFRQRCTETSTKPARTRVAAWSVGSTQRHAGSAAVQRPRSDIYCGSGRRRRRRRRSERNNTDTARGPPDSRRASDQGWRTGSPRSLGLDRLRRLGVGRTEGWWWAAAEGVRVYYTLGSQDVQRGRPAASLRRPGRILQQLGLVARSQGTCNKSNDDAGPAVMGHLCRKIHEAILSNAHRHRHASRVTTSRVVAWI